VYRQLAGAQGVPVARFDKPPRSAAADGRQEMNFVILADPLQGA
jgi:hypothetical protein